MAIELTRMVVVFGLAAAASLLLLLALTLLWPPLRIWPTPGFKSWQSYVFWPLFRGLNAICFVMALADFPGGSIGLPPWLRVCALLALAGSIGSFLYAFRVLGRDNSYGARDGLVARGVYRWSRNPQNAMLVVVYACLAIAADGARTYALCIAMIAVYILMVMTEEPWLEAVYGDSYRRYCRRVPRFFNWRRLIVQARAKIGRMRAAARASSSPT